MRKSFIRLALAGGAVGVLAAGVAAAQIPAPPPVPPVPPMPPAPPMDAMMAMGPDMMIMHHGRDLDPEKRAQRLRDVLQLRSDQEGALKAYVDATSPKITVRQDKADEKPGDKLVERKPATTLERLDRMSQAAEAMQKRVAATRAFYGALSPSQQKAFDALGLEAGGDHMFIRRFETHGPAAFKGGSRAVVIQRKVG